MVNAILYGLTLGLAAKYLIVGNRSSNFFSVLVGIAGAALTHAWATSRGLYAIGDPAENIVPGLGSILFLVGYNIYVHRHHHRPHPVKRRR